MAESGLGITMAAFMLASVMVAMVPIGGAESRDDNFNHSVKDTVNISGSYIIAVLSPGRDGIYNGLPGEVTPNNFAAVFVATYNLVSFAKTQDQIVSMARDATIDAAGSDDISPHLP